MSERLRTVALSAKGALECEFALGKICECRCEGKLHGAARGKLIDLPVDDLHSPSSECKKCKGTGKLPGYNYETRDWDENLPCVSCKGTGRVIKPAVLKMLEQMEAEEAEEADPFELFDATYCNPCSGMKGYPVFHKGVCTATAVA